MSKMEWKNRIVSQIPIGFTLCLFLYLLIDTLVGSLQGNSGHLVYTLDDPYIHMAIAKNFSEYGVWGMTRYEFSSTSSSLLYTLLLTFCFKIFGPHSVFPLLINSISAVALLLFVNFILRKNRVNFVFRLGVLLLILYSTPLIPVIFTGMEHILHAFLNLIVTYYAGLFIVQARDKSEIFFPGPHGKETISQKKLKIILLLIVPFISMVRFEGIYIIIFLSFLIMVKRKNFVYGSIFMLVGLSPILIYGLVSLANGWYFFPNSIMSKGEVISIFSIFSDSTLFWAFFEDKFYFLTLQRHIFPLIIMTGTLSLVTMTYKRKWWTISNIMIFSFVTNTIFQALFAKFSSFYRYDAYLVCLALFSLGIIVGEYFPAYATNYFDDLDWIRHKILNLSALFKKKPLQSSPRPRNITIGAVFSLIVVLMLSMGSVMFRGINGVNVTPLATRNIHDQQYQMGQFLNQYYHQEKVAVNDIGAVNFYADIQCYDMAGLGTLFPLINLNNPENYNYRLRLYEDVSNFGCKIAVCYSSWFSGPWTLVCTWKISENIVCGSDTVSFYAIDLAEAPNLRTNLHEFEMLLPELVEVRYY